VLDHCGEILVGGIVASFFKNWAFPMMSGPESCEGFRRDGQSSEIIPRRRATVAA